MKKLNKQTKYVIITSGAIIATVIAFFAITSSIIVDECAAPKATRGKDGSYMAPAVCIKVTLLDQILGRR